MSARDSVRDAFVAFSTKFEGCVSWMYLDVKGLVTVAIGNLIDPMSMALNLPFVDKTSGDAAVPAGIAAEWNQVKNHPTAAKQGHRVLEAVTRLRLTPDGIQKVVLNKFDLNDSILKSRFPDWDSWPAAAQLATHSMAWACGPAFHFVSLADSLRKGDFVSAAKQCHMDTTNNPGLVPRNAANVALYELAARVVAEGLSLDLLDANDIPFIDGGIVHPDVPLDDAA